MATPNYGGPVDPDPIEDDLTPFDRIRRRHDVTSVWQVGRYVCSLGTAVAASAVVTVEDVSPAERRDKSYSTLRVQVAGLDGPLYLQMRHHSDADPHHVLAELLTAATGR